MDVNFFRWRELLYPGEATDFFKGWDFAFDPEDASYNVNNARFLAELSRLVYRHDIEENNPPPLPTRKSFLSLANLKEEGFYQSKETDTQAMLVVSLNSPQFAVLVFRGTEKNSGDIETDLKLYKNWVNQILKTALSLSNGDPQHVHQGFLEAIDSIWKELEPDLEKLRCPIFYTGHSLGAALATLAAERLPPKALYTFGSPRVGNTIYSESLCFKGIPIYRVVNDLDIVATLPPEGLGYRHVGGLHQTNNRSVITSSIIKLLLPAKSLYDHAPINYVNRI